MLGRCGVEMIWVVVVDVTKPIRFELYFQKIESKGGIEWPLCPTFFALQKMEEEFQSEDDVTKKTSYGKCQI